MRDSWSRAYFSVLILTVVLVPSAAYVAATVTCSTAYVAKQAGFELPRVTAFYTRFGTPGFITLGGISVAVVGLMALWRHRAWAIIVCASVLVICLHVCLYAALASHFPFWTILWRLS